MRGKQTLRKRMQTIAAVLLIFGAGYVIGGGALPSVGYKSNTGLPAELDYSSVDKVYESLRANYNGKLDEAKLIEGLKHGLAEATNDPYTVYFTPSEAEDFNNDLNNTFSGIGAELGKNEQGNIQVIAPIKGTPAAKAGLQPKDVIATVDGKTTVGKSIEDVVMSIRGKAGTEVVLQIVRGDEALSVPIVRQSIQVPSVTHEIQEGNVGYLQISNFANDTVSLVNQAVSEFKRKQVSGVVLDLRNNPGGQVDAAIAVASQWLPSGTLVMQEKRGSIVTETFRSYGPGTLKDVPTTVLINNGSASAAEIVTAALKDNGKATVVGEKSYGKGVVQRLVSFSDGSELKVTIASWHRPNGKNINQQGITPDKKVTISDADATAGNDTQLKAAKAAL